MTAIALLNWLLLIFLTLSIGDPQFPYPGIVQIVGPPQPVPVPVVMPVPVGVPIAVPAPTRKTTTTTCKPLNTEQPPNKIIIPWPQFQWPVPIKNPKKFVLPFTNDNFTLKLPGLLQFPPPQGIGIPVFAPAPPPVIMIPVPPVLPNKPRPRPGHDHGRKYSSSSDSSDSSDSSSDDDSDDSDSSYINKHSKKKNKSNKNKNKYGIYRSYRRRMDRGDNDEEKPVLTYVSNDGVVKLKKQLSKQDASILLNKAQDYVHKMHVLTGHNSNGGTRVVMVSNGNEEPKAYKGHK